MAAVSSPAPPTPSPTAAPSPPTTASASGAEQLFNLGHKQRLSARIEVVNVTDNVYELRSGSGVGVNAAQYGMRMGIFGTVTYSF